MQTIIVDMTPGFRMPTIYYSQGDVGTQFAIDLRSRFGDSFPTGTTVTIQATKPSGFGFSVAATSVTNGVATFTTTAEMTDEFGRFPAELKVAKTGLTLFTANFYMDGEENTHPEGTTDGSQETVIPELTQLVERVEDAASSVLDMTVVANTLPAGSDATYSYDEETNTATFGIPKGADGSLASGVLAPTYSSSSTYAVGDYVYYSGSLYRCTTAITTAEAWTSGHWTQVALAPEVSDLKSDYTENNYIYETVSGSYIDVFSSGEFKPYASFSRSGYISTNEQAVICINSGGASQYNAFYDSDYAYVSKFSLEAGENKIKVPTNAKYFAISEATADLANTTVKRAMWRGLESIIDNAPSLADISEIIIGQNWTQGSASNRAILWIPCEPLTQYYIKFPANTNFNDVSVIQKSAKNGGALSSNSYANNSEQIITTVSNAVWLCIQFNGLSDIVSSNFDNYDLYVLQLSNPYTAVDKVARKGKNKRYIFIGDSYCEGYNPDGSTIGWGARLKTAMGLTDDNCIVKYQGGTGFYHVSSNKTFSTLLDEAGAKVIKNSVTDIVVCGGWNDNSEAVGNVYNAVLAFIAKVRDEYPNAKLYIGMIGASNDATVKQRLQNSVLYAYQYGAMADVCNYLNNVEYALSVSNLASDGIHPNADGQVQITIAIKQALETGSAYIPYRFYNQIKTS